MKNVRLHRPGAKPLRFCSFFNSNCDVLMPRNFPIRIRHLVEKNPTDSIGLLAKNRLN